MRVHQGKASPPPVGTAPDFYSTPLILIVILLINGD